MPFHKHVLPNGLTILGETSPAARSTAIGFFVRTGSRDETPEVSGVSHFLEHMVFKGTPRRSARDVNLDLDRIGSWSNASTSEENTIYYAAVLPEYLPKALDVLADILRPSLRTEDFDMEKNVIIEEIGMYEDQPASCAFDNAKRIYFGEHKLGSSILGTVESITALTRDQMYAYFERRYVPSNIIVSVAGNFDWLALVDEVGRRCGDWQPGPIGREGVAEVRGTGRTEVIVKPKVTQQHVILVASGPPANSPLRYAADMLAMAVGDDSGSRLYWELVDPGQVDSAEQGFQEYEGTGSFYTSISGEPENTRENLDVVLAVLSEITKTGITDEELHQARSKMLSMLVRGSERPMGRMMALGMNWLYQSEYRSVDDELKRYEAVTLADVRTVLDRYPLDNVTTLALGPLTAM